MSPPPPRRRAGYRAAPRSCWLLERRLFRTRGRCGSRTSRHHATSWLISVDPSRLARRNDLDDHVYRAFRPFVTDQVYVPAAYVCEAVACMVNRRRAGGVVSLVYGEFARQDGDQAWPRVRVPPRMSLRPAMYFGRYKGPNPLLPSS